MNGNGVSVKRAILRWQTLNEEVGIQSSISISFTQLSGEDRQEQQSNGTATVLLSRDISICDVLVVSVDIPPFILCAQYSTVCQTRMDVCVT